MRESYKSEREPERSRACHKVGGGVHMMDSSKLHEYGIMRANGSV